LIVSETDLGGPPADVFAGLQGRKGCFLLESARPDGGRGSFSFAGFDPFLTFRSRGRTIEVERGGRTENRVGDPLGELGALLRSQRGPSVPGIPFSGGAVGHIGYELCSLLERIPEAGPDDLDVPDLQFGFHDGFLAWDHSTGRTYLVATPAGGRDPGLVLEGLRSALGQARPGGACMADGAAASVPVSNFSREEYLRAVERVRGYIATGDVYQVNLSQRFEAPLPCGPFGLYRRLREASPAPFAAYLDQGWAQVVCASPELFLRIRGGLAQTRPIKGTRPRGATPQEDARLAAELLASGKDRAELLMIVDLERNDLGRVCAPGTIRVEDMFRLESHPTVHHLVATVSGTLREECDAVDCIRAMFPGGSITGAPKVRAMQVIAGMETRRRGVYTGAIGYLGFDGNCDLNIAIRTITCRGDRAFYHAGGGIVWDSDPAAEYQETLDKARAMTQAVGAIPGET
jgi:para-aminobenzoate synthetase component I